MDLIAAMDELVTADGGHFLVVVWPLLESLEHYPFTEIHQRLATSLEAKGIAHIDLLSTLSAHETSELHVHPTDHHPNEVAHSLAAQAISEELARRNWLPADSP